MIMNRRVALGGTQLDSLDDSIVIRSTDPGVARENVSAVDRMGGIGQRITSEHWSVLEASVTFAIDIPKRQLTDRREVFDKVIAWALGKGWLTMNQMPDKRLYVDKVVLPGGGDMWEWTNEYTITFKAYDVPFWQDDEATEATIAAADEGSGSITVPGLMETVCDAEITNASGNTIDSMSVTVGSSVMSFTSLGLADEEKLVIGHEGGTLYIRIYTGSSYFRRAMDKRTGSSADDLYVTPGAKAITITGGSVTAKVSCFGRYV